MDTRGTTMRQIAIMQVMPEEAEVMNRLNTMWAMTMDIKHQNVLAYPIDVVVEDVDEVWPRKYIDSADFSSYTCEDGSEWLISSSLGIDDINAFFKTYLREEEAAA